MPTVNPEPGQLFEFDLPRGSTPALSAEVRDNFNALARTHYTTDAAFPEAPRDGMPRINAVDPNNVKLEFWLPGSGGGSVWRRALSFLNLGFGAPAKRVVQFTVAATSWTVDHNIGSFVLALAFDANGYAFDPIGPPPAVIGVGQVQIRQVNENRVVFSFSGPTSGFAVIIG